MKLSPLFFQHDDVVSIGRSLLGKFLITEIDGKPTGGMIIETESYKGPEDRACHAYKNRKTKRTKIFFNPGGIAYIYQCYGIHLLFNVITGKKDMPHGVLIRAIEPLFGIEYMLERRKKQTLDHTLASGPGSVTKALGIQLKHNGTSLDGPFIWIEDKGIQIPPEKIIASPRIGVAYAGEDALLPWRFCISKW